MLLEGKERKTVGHIIYIYIYIYIIKINTVQYINESLEIKSFYMSQLGFEK